MPKKADVGAISPNKTDVPGDATMDTTEKSAEKKRGKAAGTKEWRVDLSAAKTEDVNGSKGARYPPPPPRTCKPYAAHRF